MAAAVHNHEGRGGEGGRPPGGLGGILGGPLGALAGLLVVIFGLLVAKTVPKMGSRASVNRFTVHNQFTMNKATKGLGVLG